MMTVQVADPCRNCGDTEAKVDEQRCFDEWLAAGHRAEDFSVVQCEHLICTTCGLTL